MSGDASPSAGSLPLSERRRVDEACDRFEAAWKMTDAGGPRPRIEDFLGETTEPVRMVLLRELIALAVHYRKRAGEIPSAQDYRERFPGIDLEGVLAQVRTLRNASGDAIPASPPSVQPICGPGLPVVPNHDLLELLGTGGMGAVYKALDRRLKRIVALKVIKEGLAGAAHLARFQVEAESVARLNHPHIVQIYEVGRWSPEGGGEHPWLALEYVQGPNLEKRLHRQPVEPREAAGLLRLLAQAVQAAHGKGIIHRDLKPANVLLAPPADEPALNCAWGWPKLTDFGLARRVEGGAGTHSGMVMGTPSYMAPEQAEGKQVGPAADVYALGAILYQLLTGRPPFVGDSSLRTIHMVLTEAPAPPRRLQPIIPEALDSLCLACLDKQPERRPGVAGLIVDLARFLAGDPVLTVLVARAAGPTRERAPTGSSPPGIHVFVQCPLEFQPERQAVERTLARLLEARFIASVHFAGQERSVLEANVPGIHVEILSGRIEPEADCRRALGCRPPCFLYVKEESLGQNDRDSTRDERDRLARLKEDLRRRGAVSFSGPIELAEMLTADLNRWVHESYLLGLNALGTDAASRIQNFLAEYLGTLKEPVPFGGRDDELALLDGWLDDLNAQPYLLLGAPAGRGKSALLVRWTQRLLTRPDLAIAFVPVSIRFRTNLAGFVFPAVTAQLAALHGDQVPTNSHTTLEVWRGMMLNYLARPLPDGRRLLVILDGLDESADWEPGPELFPGNPRSSLRVLLSARLRAGDADAESWLGSLGWDRTRLGKALDLARLTASGVADVLQRMGCPLDILGRRVDLVRELHRLSDGDPLLVRLYVEDLWKQGESAGKLRPEDLQSLQPGLKGYFNRWWDEQRRLWGSQSPLREPAVQGVLNLLACALGPLSRDDLLRLAPAELGLTTWSLDDTLRPLSRFVVGDGAQQGFVFSHPRLAGYFHERLAARERQLTEARFLEWGEEALAGLNEGRLAPEEVSPYLVQYHGAHLERTRAAPERLLALVSDGWRRAWEMLEGSHAGFRNDVDRAWQSARAADELIARRGGAPKYLGQQVRCALAFASISSLAGNIRPGLLKCSVERGALTSSQAIACARQMPQPRHRSTTLAALSECLPEPQKSLALEQALASVWSIEDTSDRIDLLISLAARLAGPLVEQLLHEAGKLEDEEDRSRLLLALSARLSEPLKSQTLEESIRTARAIRDENARSKVLSALASGVAEILGSSGLAELVNALQTILSDQLRAKALTKLAPHLTGPLLEQCFHIARSITGEGARARALTALAPFLSGSAVAEALQAAQTIEDEDYKANLLGALAPRLSGSLLEQALGAVRAIVGESTRSLALSFLAPALTGPSLEQALESARLLVDEWPRSQALAALAVRLPGPRRSQVLASAVDAARKIGMSTSETIEPNRWMIPHLDESRTTIKDSLDPTDTITDEDEITKVLAALAAHLPDLVTRTGQPSAATANGREGERSKALALLAPLLSEPQQSQVLIESVQAARAIADDEDRSQALTAVAPQLSEPLKSQVLEEALAAGRAIKDEDDRGKSIVAVVRLASGSLLEQCLRAVGAIANEDSRFRALVRLAPHLSGSVMQPALRAAQDLDNETARSYVVVALAPRLSGAVLEQALEAARAMWGAGNRSRALAALAPRLSEPLLDCALESARDLASDWARASALTALAPYLSKPLLEQALQAARAIGDDDDRIRTRAAFAPHLSEPERSNALEHSVLAAGTMWNHEHRWGTLLDLAPYLSGPLLERLLHVGRTTETLASTVGRAMRDGWSEGNLVDTLAELTPRLAEPLREQVLTQAMQSIPIIEREDARAKALATLAPQLTVPLLEQGLQAAQAIRDSWSRLRALAALAERLPEPARTETLEHALKAAGSIGDSRARALTLLALAPQLSEPLRREVLEQAVQAALLISDEKDRSSALIDVAAHLNEPLRSEVLEKALAASRAIGDEHDLAGALAEMAPHLSEALLGRAVESAQAIWGEDARLRALTGLAHRLSGALLERALQIAEAMKDPWARAGTLTALAPRLLEPRRLQILETVLKAAGDIFSEAPRAQALMALAPLLSEPQRREALEQALRAASAIKDDDDRSKALSALAGHLSGTSLPLALQAVGKIGAESAQSKALAAFAPHLSGPLLEQAWQNAQSIGGQEARSLALSSLIPSMLKRPEHSLYLLWKHMLPVLAGRTRRDLLADLRTLLPVFLRCGGAESAADVFTAIEEMGRWWP